MPRWIRDDTGRFERRPYYEADELDRECEAIVEAHLRRRHGEVRYPIATDELHVLIERHGARIDAYADLSEHGSDAEGMTKFVPDEPPLVMISRALATDPRRENRLRTTLAHEFGHVHFHGPLYAELFRKRSGNADCEGPAQGVCKRDDILDAPNTDWMEWQAGYVCGAILMPAAATRHRLSKLLPARNSGEAVLVGSGLDRTALRVIRTGCLGRCRADQASQARHPARARGPREDGRLASDSTQKRVSALPWMLAL